jgi:DNA-directed RNA polymerase beta' subunit
VTDIYPTNEYMKKEFGGFITNSFAQGLNPRQLFSHAIPSRESIVRTATGTARAGYLNHRIVKIMDDVHADMVNQQIILNSSFPKTISLLYNQEAGENNGKRIILPLYPKNDNSFLKI